MKHITIGVNKYLKLLKEANVRQSKEYALVNQDIRKGVVYFRTAHKMKAFKALLTACETGFPPETEVYRQKVSEYNWDKSTDGLTVEIILEKVENIRGPGHDGYYTGRCPSCAAKGNAVGQVWDDDSSHFRFNPEDMIIHCFSGCNKFDIVGAIK